MTTRAAPHRAALFYCTPSSGGGGLPSRVPITFEQPLWLLTALLALPMGWIGLKWLGAMSGPRRWSAVVLRAVLVGLIACMLAGAAAVRSTDRVAVVAVIDASDSVRQFASRFGAMPLDDKGKALAWDGAVKKWLETARTDRGVDDLVGAVVFDGTSMALSTPTAAGDFDIAFDQRGAQGTDIEGALRFARALFPAGANRRLVLVSDGNQTSGDALAAAVELASDRIPIDVVPLSYSVKNEVIVESVDAPPRAAAGSTVRVRVVLDSTDGATGTLELMHEGRPLDINESATGTGRRVTLPPGRSVEMIDVPLPDATVHRFEPVFVPDDPNQDQLATNNRAQTFTVTPGKGRVLVVDGVSNAEAGGAGLTLPSTLERAGFEVLTVRPDDIPRDLLSLNAHDLIVLENVPADAVDRSVQSAIAEYVNKLGGGLIMVGGPDSFGAGGWKGTPIEPLLPVNLDLPEQVMAFPAAVALVIDNSGSMARGLAGSANSKQRIANEGAALAVLALDKSDALCVIAFNSSPEIVIPPARNKDARKNAELVRAISSGGGTNIGGALHAAGAQLMQLDRAPVKHVILLTDGRDEGRSDLAGIAEELKAKGITVSTIGIGDDVDDQVMAAMAKRGGGKYYRVTDPSVLPRVFVKEVRVVRKPLIRETPFVPRVAPGAMIADGLGTIPALDGLVLTQPRTGAKATTAMVTPEGEPLLATWPSGRGQVAAFTSDAHANWAKRWIAWPGYTQLWTRLVRSTARPASETSSELTVQVTGDTLRIRLDAAENDGTPMDMLNVPGTVYLPEGKSVDVRLTQTGPGTYEASLPAKETGNYIVALSPSSPGAGAGGGGGGRTRTLAPVLGGASLASGPETRRLKSNVSLLERIARTTGGRVLELAKPNDAKLFDRDTLTPTLASIPLWRTLLLWTLVVLVLDIATRRVAWDRLLSREWRLAMREHAEKTVKARAEQAAGTLQALRKASGADPADPSQAAAVNEPAKLKAPTRASRPTRPGTVPSLAEDEAEKLRNERLEMEKSARREALRAQMLRSRASGGPGAGEDPSGGAGRDHSKSPPEKTDAEAAQATSDLLKAKRRAREQFDDTDRTSG